MSTRALRLSLMNYQAPPNAGQQQSAKAYEEAKTHMKMLMNTEKINATPGPTKGASKMYDVGNVTLFLAGDMGAVIRSSAVLTDGSYSSLM